MTLTRNNNNLREENVTLQRTITNLEVEINTHKGTINNLEEDNVTLMNNINTLQRLNRYKFLSLVAAAGVLYYASSPFIVVVLVHE